MRRQVRCTRSKRRAEEGALNKARRPAPMRSQSPSASPAGRVAASLRSNRPIVGPTWWSRTASSVVVRPTARSAWQLEADGYQVVFQGWDFTPGRDWAHGMQQATTAAERLVVVLSAPYLESVHGEAEWRAFYVKDPSGERGLLLPVRVSDVEPPGLLRTRIYVDLVGLDANSARTMLLAAARGVRGKPTSEPEFPGTHGQSVGSGIRAPRFPGKPENQSGRSPRGVLPPERLQAVSSEVAWQRVGAVAELGRLLHAQPGEVAAQARAVLQRSIDDDSRLVSQAAIRALSTRPSAHWSLGKIELLRA